MSDRAKQTDHVIFALPELTDEALAEVSAFVDTLPRRPLTGESLAAEQRAREAACLLCREHAAGPDLHDTATDAAAVLGASYPDLPFDPGDIGITVYPTGPADRASRA